jgi:hypothetical protein
MATGDDEAAPAEAQKLTLGVYNFDHGITSPVSLAFGPYLIHVRAIHLDPEILTKGEARHFGWDVDASGRLSNVVTTTPPHPGRWAPTAEIEDHDRLHQGSPLFPEVPGRIEKDDVALILSFITGRNVVIGNDVPQTFWLSVGERIVGNNYFYRPHIDWGALTSETSAGIGEGMHVICHAASSSDLITQLALGCVALDRLSGDWWKNSGQSRYKGIEKTTRTKAIEAFSTSLKDSGAPESVTADIAPRMHNLFADSALAKLQDFLVAHEMFPQNAPKQVLDRLKLLNANRNLVLHNATIRVDKNASFQRNTEIAGAISILILMICRTYIAKYILKIDDGKHGIEAEKKTVSTFFETGQFRGQDVFTESFDAYLARIQADWISTGQAPF